MNNRERKQCRRQIANGLVFSDLIGQAGLGHTRVEVQSAAKNG